MLQFLNTQIKHVPNHGRLQETDFDRVAKNDFYSREMPIAGLTQFGAAVLANNTASTPGS